MNERSNIKAKKHVDDKDKKKQDINQDVNKLIIKNSLINFDDNKMLYKDTYDLIYNSAYKKFFHEESDLEYSYIKFYDGNDKEILHKNYEVLGYYNVKSGTWLWGWALATHKKYIRLMKKLLNYAFEIDNEILRIEMLTSKIKINDPIQLDIYIAMASYLCKVPIIYEERFNYDTYISAMYHHNYELKQQITKHDFDIDLRKFYFLF